MEFINFEACVDDNNISDEDEVNFSVEKDNDFLDDSDEISENVCKYYRFHNVTRSAEDALEDAFINSSIDLENRNGVTNFCGNSDEKVPEIDDFDRSSEKVDKFEKSLFC